MSETCADRAEKAESESGLWWLSFVVDGKFAGAVFAEGKTAANAIRRAHLYGCNPGGEVAYRALPLALLDHPLWGPVWEATPRHVLMDRPTLEALGHLDAQKRHHATDAVGKRQEGDE